jgi:hypothetical protein
MPPCLDVYVFVNGRSRSLVDQFLDKYVDRAGSEDREGEELLMERLDLPSDTHPAARHESVPTRTLTHAIDLGLGDPKRAFTVYLRPKDSRFSGAILCFTSDDKLVCGLSLDDEDEKKETLDAAKSTLRDLCDQLGSDMGLILVEQPPPSNEAAFRKEMADGGNLGSASR